jgi:hypothetical protein
VSQRLLLYLIVAIAVIGVLLMALGLGGFCASRGREEPIPVIETPKDLVTAPLPVREVATVPSLGHAALPASLTAPLRPSPPTGPTATRLTKEGP